MILDFNNKCHSRHTNLGMGGAKFRCGTTYPSVLTKLPRILYLHGRLTGRQSGIGVVINIFMRYTCILLGHNIHMYMYMYVHVFVNLC